MEKGRKILEKTSEVAVILIDLDQFKQINNTYGHMTGNKVLLEFSGFPKKEMMNTDYIIGRLGGDGFVVLLYNFPESRLQRILSSWSWGSEIKLFILNRILRL